MGLKIDGIFSPEVPDKAAQIVLIKGMDISSLEEGHGLLNTEHIMPGKKDDGNIDPKDKDTFNTIIGRVLSAKKIFSEKDCEDDRQKQYWEFIKVPFLYGVGELFDDEDHPGAKAAAAIIRHHHKRGLPIRIKYSVEGDTLEKNGNYITRSIVKHIACTIKPCNAAAASGVMEDNGKADESPIVLQKSLGDSTFTRHHEIDMTISVLQSNGDGLVGLKKSEFDDQLDLLDQRQHQYDAFLDAAAFHFFAAKSAHLDSQKAFAHPETQNSVNDHAAKAEHYIKEAIKIFAQRHRYSEKAATYFVEKDLKKLLQVKFANVDPQAVIGQHHPQDDKVLGQLPDQPEEQGEAPMQKADYYDFDPKKVMTTADLSDGFVNGVEDLPGGAKDTLYNRAAQDHVEAYALHNLNMARAKSPEEIEHHSNMASKHLNQIGKMEEMFYTPFTNHSIVDVLKAHYDPAWDYWNQHPSLPKEHPADVHFFELQPKDEEHTTSEGPVCNHCLNAFSNAATHEAEKAGAAYPFERKLFDLTNPPKYPNDPSDWDSEIWERMSDPNHPNRPDVIAAKNKMNKAENDRLDYARERQHTPPPPDISQIHKRPLGMMGAYEVWGVDGNQVRNNHDIDFVGGGNPSRYQYVPQDELWVDEGVNDPAAFAVHEYEEAEDMEHNGDSYDDAHEKASHLEQEFRQQHPRGASMRDAEDFWQDNSPLSKSHNSRRFNPNDSFRHQRDPIDILDVLNELAAEHASASDSHKLARKIANPDGSDMLPVYWRHSMMRKYHDQMTGALIDLHDNITGGSTNLPKGRDLNNTKVLNPGDVHPLDLAIDIGGRGCKHCYNRLKPLYDEYNSTPIEVRMNKAMTAGGGAAAPQMRSQGAALAKDNKKPKSAIKDNKTQVIQNAQQLTEEVEVPKKLIAKKTK